MTGCGCPPLLAQLESAGICDCDCSSSNFWHYQISRLSQTVQLRCDPKGLQSQKISFEPAADIRILFPGPTCWYRTVACVQAQHACAKRAWLGKIGKSMQVSSSVGDFPGQLAFVQGFLLSGGGPAGSMGFRSGLPRARLPHRCCRLWLRAMNPRMLGTCYASTFEVLQTPFQVGQNDDKPDDLGSPSFETYQAASHVQ